MLLEITAVILARGICFPGWEFRCFLTEQSVSPRIFLVFRMENWLFRKNWLIRFRPGRFDLGRYSGLEPFEIFDEQAG